MFKKSLKKLLKCCSGVTAVEFAFFIPILFILLIGSVELSRYIIIIQKLDKTAYTIADMIAQTEPNTPGQPIENVKLTQVMIEDVLSLYEELMSPYWESDLAVAAALSFTQYNTSTPPTIDWGVTGGGTSNAKAVSDITGQSISAHSSLAGSSVNLSADLQNIVNSTFSFFQDENVIVVEAFYEYKPLFVSTLINIPPKLLKRTTFFAPRYGNLGYLP
jgi:Flp pilus assembly protein TadG